MSIPEGFGYLIIAGPIAMILGVMAVVLFEYHCPVEGCRGKMKRRKEPNSYEVYGHQCTICGYRSTSMG